MRPRRRRGHPPCWSACRSYPCAAPRHNYFDSTSLAANENSRDSRLHRPPQTILGARVVFFRHSGVHGEGRLTLTPPQNKVLPLPVCLLRNHQIVRFVKKNIGLGYKTIFGSLVRISPLNTPSPNLLTSIFLPQFIQKSDFSDVATPRKKAIVLNGS